MNYPEWFNFGIIVNEDLEKPCKTLHCCPYGTIAKRFPMRKPFEKYTCAEYHNDCPVFYIAESVTEDSIEKSIKNRKLKDGLTKETSRLGKNLFWKQDVLRWMTHTSRKFDSADLDVKNWKIKKACHKLKYCPYGSLGQEFISRKIKDSLQCKVFAHNCPVFYYYFYRYSYDDLSSEK